MEKRLQEFMGTWDMNVFEVITLAIQVADRLYPTELAFRRDRIIERLYGGSNVRSLQGQTAAQRSPYQRGPIDHAKGKGNMKLSGKPETRPKIKPLTIRELSDQPRAAKPAPTSTKQQGSIDAKGKGKMQFSEKPRKCPTNKSLRISEPPQSQPPRPVPVGTKQVQLSAAKGKGKELCTDFAATFAAGYNKKNTQVKYPVKTMPPREIVKKHSATSSKCLSINDGRIAKKPNSTNRVLPGSCSRSSRGKQVAEAEAEAAAFSDYLILSDDSSDGEENADNPQDWLYDQEEAEDPRNWWYDKELVNSGKPSRDEDKDKDTNYPKLKRSQGSDDA